ncbi:TPA: protein kinase domain-containing protein [Escherichia coli]
MEERGNYLIEPLEVIGSGGFGLVEKIRLYNSQRKICGLYARKILRPDATDPELFTRFEREVRYQTECLHTNIVQIFICHLQNAQPWFVMELAETNLEEEIKSGTLTKAEKISIVKMVLNAVGWIHKKGYLHRDIKPLNVLKFKDGIYKLSDFGLAKNVSPDANTQLLTQIGQSNTPLLLNTLITTFSSTDIQNNQIYIQLVF